MNPAEEKKPLPLSAEPEVRREPMTVRQDAESVVSRLSATRMAIVSRLGYDPIEVYKTFGDWFKARPADADAGLWFDL
jgi:hypothetical protein